MMYVMVHGNLIWWYLIVFWVKISYGLGHGLVKYNIKMCIEILNASNMIKRETFVNLCLGYDMMPCY